MSSHHSHHRSSHHSRPRIHHSSPHPYQTIPNRSRIPPPHINNRISHLRGGSHRDSSGRLSHPSRPHIHNNNNYNQSHLHTHGHSHSHSRSNNHESHSHTHSYAQSNSHFQPKSQNHLSSSNTNTDNKELSSTSHKSYWSEHRSSSGKTYYYNTKTGLSQWDMPPELIRQRNNNTSPESDISESSSIRQQQEDSPSSNSSSRASAQSEAVSEDKPLLTPSLEQYYKSELIIDSYPSHLQELERQADEHSKQALKQAKDILENSIKLKMAKSEVLFIETSVKAQEEKCVTMKEWARQFGYT